jgi:serine/threonine protein kinase
MSEIDNYILYQPSIGRGAEGEVFKALDKETGKEVVIKLPHPDVNSDSEARD